MWALNSKPFTFECAACGLQTSVTAGTIFHRSHPPLLTWFQASYETAHHRRIELSPEGQPRRIRLAPLGNFSAPSIGAFVAGEVT